MSPLSMRLVAAGQHPGGQFSKAVLWRPADVWPPFFVVLDGSQQFLDTGRDMAAFSERITPSLPYPAS